MTWVVASNEGVQAVVLDALNCTWIIADSAHSPFGAKRMSPTMVSDHLIGD